MRGREEGEEGGGRREERGREEGEECHVSYGILNMSNTYTSYTSSILNIG